MQYNCELKSWGDWGINKGVIFPEDASEDNYIDDDGVASDKYD